LVEVGLDAETFADDGDQDVNRDGDPDLCLHRVLTGSIESFDAQVLFDPLEEQLHLPALLVDFGDGQGWQREVLDRKTSRLMVFLS